MHRLIYHAMLLLTASTQAYSDNTLVVGDFSGSRPDQAYPMYWELLSFDKVPEHTNYSLVSDNGTTVVKADSSQSASGLIRKINIDPEQYPVIQWRWKIVNLIQKSNIHKKNGDDYPARLYITFAYEPDRLGFLEKIKYQAARLLYGEIPSAAINYIWAQNEPVGTLVDNAYTAYTKMFVVQSGAKHTGKWMAEERNVYQDYIQAFGKRPPMINGIAIMTDTDNTGEMATAYYGDILFKGQDQSE